MKNISLTCKKINKIAMNAIRPLGLLIAIIISLSMFSCKPAEEPAVVPGKPSLTDLSGELSEEERCGAIRFKVSVPVLMEGSCMKTICNLPLPKQSMCQGFLPKPSIA